MAEIQLWCCDASLWRAHYMEWRERYGIGSPYIKSLRDVVSLAIREDRLGIDQREALSMLVRQIDDEYGAGTRTHRNELLSLVDLMDQDRQALVASA